jgi:hypothetical protein
MMCSWVRYHGPSAAGLYTQHPLPGRQAPKRVGFEGGRHILSCAQTQCRAPVRASGQLSTGKELLKCWPRQLLGIFWKEFLSFFCVFDSTYLFEQIQSVGDEPSLYKFAISYAIDGNSRSCYLVASRS